MQDLVETPKSVWARRLRELDRWDVLILVLLSALFLITQIEWLLRAIAFSDQLDYFSAAGGLQESAISHRKLRIGLTFPVRAAIEVFGYSEAAYYAVPITAGLLFLIATYLLGALLHSRAVGTIAAVAATFNPHVMWESSHLLPDLLGAALFTLGIVAIGASAGTERYRLNPSLIVAGALLAWSYLTREFVVIFFPLALVALWSAGGVRLRRVISLAVGAVGVLAVEFLHGALVFGDPVARIRSVVNRATPTLNVPAPGTGSRPEAENSLVETALLFPRQILRRDGGWMLLFLAAVLICGFVVAVLLRRRTAVRRLLLPMTWIVVIYGVMTLAGWTATSDGRSVIRISKIRYWYPIFPAITVGGALGLLLLIPRERSGQLMYQVAVAALGAITLTASFLGLESIRHSASFVSNGGDSEFEEFRQWLTDEGEAVERLYVDSDHFGALDLMLPVYAKTPFGRPLWMGQFESVSVDEPLRPTELRGPVVMHSHSTARMVNSNELLPYLEKIPLNWRPLMVAANGKLVVLSTDPEGNSNPTHAETDGGSLSSQDDNSAVAQTDDGPWQLDVPEGGRARLRYMTPDPEREHPAVVIQLRDDAAGEGSIAVHCDFEIDGRERAFAIQPQSGDPAASTFYCSGRGLSGVMLDLRGPLQGSIDEVTVKMWNLD